MIFKKILLFLAIPLLADGSPTCREIFHSDSSLSHSLPINPFLISNEARQAQENFNQPQKKSDSTSSPSSIAPVEWLAQYKKRDSRSEKTLRKMIQRGQRFGRKRYLESADHDFFRFLNALKQNDLNMLSSSQQIAIFKLFGNWSLVPSESFQHELSQAMSLKLQDWTSQDFLDFALTRKLSPFAFSEPFTQSFKNNLVQNFAKLDAVTQMESLGAELLQMTFFTVKEMNDLLNATSLSLRKSGNEVFRLKPLKELYRALFFLRARETSHFFMSAGQLELQIEQKMNLIHLSLDQGGTSGSKHNPLIVSQDRQLLEDKIAIAFSNPQKIYEYMKAQHFGFFDPVDIFYPQLKLVIEWDGPHHYHRRLDERGDLTDGNKRLILRPIDRAKDLILRRHGYIVARFPPELNNELKDLDVKDYIDKQN